MQKKKLIIAVTASTLSLGVAAFALAQGYDAEVRKGYASGEQFKITLNNKGAVEEQEEGLYHQAKIRNNKFDLLGWSDNGGDLGSIKKATYGNYEYNGMIYNRSAINGLESLKVNFTGSSLHYVFTDFLMENMNFDGPALTSDVAVEVPDNKAYFIVYNTSETPTNIDSLELTYRCDGNIDATMIYNKNTALGGARSVSKTTTPEDSFITLENNPTQYTNNYSQGKHQGHANNDSWYRWNGRYFSASDELGTEFTFAMTLAAEYGRMIDESKYFHINVWPQFGWMNGETNMANDNSYAQIYIGNDNYEPLGKDHALNPTDPYVNESYAGRFFTDYGWYNEAWQFADPDTTYIPDQNKHLTMREAYEQYNLPFWFVKFHVYLTTVVDGTKEYPNTPVCDIYINNMLMIEQQELFDTYDRVDTPSIFINTLPMHLVNYGVDAKGTPGESYTGMFTYPRLIG